MVSVLLEEFFIFTKVCYSMNILYTFSWRLHSNTLLSYLEFTLLLLSARALPWNPLSSQRMSYWLSTFHLASTASNVVMSSLQGHPPTPTITSASGSQGLEETRSRMDTEYTLWVPLPSFLSQASTGNEWNNGTYLCLFWHRWRISNVKKKKLLLLNPYTMEPPGIILSYVWMG